MSNNLIVEFEKCAHEVQFDAPIKGISVSGQKLSDVHDLTEKVAGMTKTIKILAYTATAVCLLCFTMAVFVTHWLLSHESSIEQLLLTSNSEYSQEIADAEKWNSHRRERAYIHLQEFHGLHWDEGMQDWVNHAISSNHNRMSRNRK